MRICYINLDYPPNLGGISAIAYNLITAVSKNKIVESIKVVSFKNKNSRNEKFGKLRVKTFGTRDPKKIALGTIREIWKNRNCDIFHATDFFPIAFYILIFGKFILRKKLFVSVFGTDTLSREGSRKTKFAKKLILKYSDAVFVVSESTSRRVKEFYNLEGKNFVVTYAGMNKSILDVAPKDIREKHKIKKDDFVIITVCRLIKRKGVDDLIKVVKEIEDKKVKLIIVGDGPEMDNLHNLCSKLGVRDRVIFAGAMDNPADYYSSSNVFSMPSKYLKEEGDIEGLGIVYIEAQYFGLPVIGSDSGGIPEAIYQGKTGFVVPENDVKALAEKILYLKNNQDAYREFSKNAKKFVKEKFDWDVLAKKFINYYNK